MGRPVEPVPEDIAEAVCDWIADGKPLVAFCRQPGMPNRRTIGKWRRKDDEFRAQFARAREDGADSLAEEALEIADETSNDTITKTGRDGAEYDSPNTEWIQRSKLRAELRLKLAACFCPSVYGSKVQVGGDGGEPIRVVDKGAAVKEIASILATAAARKD